MSEIHVPPYYKQNTPETCGLAALRMALADFGTTVSEQELVARITPDYGENFTILWKPTIARLACEYGIKTTFSADWPLLQPTNMQNALAEFAHSPDAMDISRYENVDVPDEMPQKEPVGVGYRDMFRAVQLGCDYRYAALTADRLRAAVAGRGLVQAVVNLQSMYPDEMIEGMHQLLVFDATNQTIRYHDPDRQPDMSCSVEHFFGALNNIGAFIAYRSGVIS